MLNSLLYPRLQRKCGLGLSVTLLAVALSNFSWQTISSKSVDSLFSNFSFGQVATAQTTAQSTAQSTAQTDWATADWATIEQEIITEHNRLRQNPQSYIPLLEAYLASMTEDGHIIHGCGQNCVLTTREGRPAVEEAIAFLRQQPAVGPVQVSPPVAQAAKAHALDQQDGQVGHTSSDGTSFFQRLSQFGIQGSGVGENISYGATSAQDVMMKLLIDDGVPSRGHRENIFAPSWTKAGAGCGTHAMYRTVCVIDYVTQ